MINNIIKIRILLWTLLAVIVGVLFYFAIIPTGKITYTTNFSESSEFISKLGPIERVDESESWHQRIIGDPVYFSLRTPRTFNTAKMTIKYKASENYPGLIEVGNLVDGIVWRHDLKPIENEVINKLSMVWDVIQEDEMMLLQREGKYESVQEFLDEVEKPESSINLEEILTYNYDLQKEYIINDYEKSEEENNIAVPLRGSYQFYTYIKDEDLNFDFSIVDLNQNRDEDSVEVLVFYEDEVIDSVELEDDGNSADDGVMSEERSLNLNSVNLPEGVYKIEMKANDDIVTTNIQTTQSKISFLNKLWIYNGDLENISLYTDSNNLQFNTTHPEGLQTVIVDNKDIVIEETYSQYVVDIFQASTTLVNVNLKKDGVIVSGNGLFSFNYDNFFNPVIKKLNSNTDLNTDKINFVLANYQLPAEEGEWKVVTQEYNLKDSYREFYKYGFVISVPGLDSEDGLEDFIEISEIKFELEGRSLLEKIKEVLGVRF